MLNGRTWDPRRYPLPVVWSTYKLQAVLTAGAGNIALPDITVAGIPAGTTVAWALLFCKFSGRENTSASVNSISGAQNIRVQKAVAGAYITAIALVGGEYSTAIGATIAANAEAAGDVIAGTADISAQVPANGAVMNVQWTNAVAAFANLNINDIQVGLQMWVTVP